MRSVRSGSPGAPLTDLLAPFALTPLERLLPLMYGMAQQGRPPE
jgi:hypothetical protein